MDLIVTSTVDGRRRGGGQFTGATKIDPEKFTTAQLSEIIADPALTLVYGAVITAEDVSDALAHARIGAVLRQRPETDHSADLGLLHPQVGKDGKLVVSDAAISHLQDTPAPAAAHSTAGDLDHEKDVVHPTTEMGLETGKPIVHQGTESVGNTSQKASTSAANKAAPKGAKS